jgi:hypothetical protein
VGEGFIISRPQTYFYYDEFHTIFGFQARAACHLYLFRNFSFSGGVEMNIYQNLEMPAVEVPSGDSESQIVLNAHTLNYSTLRFKVGAHLYF